MADDDVALVRGEIEKHAGSVDAVAAAVEQAKAAGAQVKLGRGAYGQLCQLIPTLIDPIQQLGIDALTEAGSTLTTTAGSLRTAAGQYSGTDDTSATLFPS